MEKFILSEEQQNIILGKLMTEQTVPPTIKELIEILFPGQNLDARSKEGRSIREFIADKNLEYTGARTWVPKKVIELTEEKKAFISNNINAMKPLEMARTLFENRELTNTDSETREIYKYIKTLPGNIQSKSIGEPINIKEYQPPKTEDQAIARINKYIQNSEVDRNKLTEKNKRDIKNLLGYMHTLRYLSQINTYFSVIERDLFESEFIRCTYDKALTEEEVSQYIIYCTEVVIAKQISRRIQDLEGSQDIQLEENQGRLNMSLVEAVSSLRKEYNDCISRQKSSLKSLQGERKERLKNEGANKGNISDLIVYAQNQEKRNHLLKIAAERREKIKEEIVRIKNLDEIKAEIFGISEREILD
jgi:hypothetical protein